MSILSSTAVMVPHMSKTPPTCHLIIGFNSKTKTPGTQTPSTKLRSTTFVMPRLRSTNAATTVIYFVGFFLASSLATVCQFLFLSTVGLVRGTWQMINSSPSSKSFTLVMCGTLINLVLVKICLPTAAMQTSLNVLATSSQLKDGSLTLVPDCFIFWLS